MRLHPDVAHEFDYPHGSLMRCLHCGRWFHNEADAGEIGQPCPSREAVSASPQKPV